MYSEDNLNKIKGFKELVDKGFSLIKPAEMVTVEYQSETMTTLIHPTLIDGLRKCKRNIILRKLQHTDYVIRIVHFF